MKKVLLTTLFVSLAAITLRADLIYYEPFNYLNGPIIATGTNLDGSTNWFRHSGAASPSDAIVSNHKLQNSQGSGAVSRSDDVHRDMVAPYTNSQTVVYASFTLNCTNLPTLTNYFAHFYVNSSTLHARLFFGAGSMPGTYRLFISGVTSTLSLLKMYPVDLVTNVDYQVVIQWDPVSTFSATLWVNPISSADPAVTSNDAVATPAASTAFAFRQATSAGATFINITNLATATSFDEAATNVWSTNAVGPVVVLQPKGGTNFIGDAVSIASAAAGQGQGALTYTWLKDGAGVANANGNSNVLAISSAAVSDTGNYQMVATTPYGLSATSAVAFLWVTNAPVPPTFTTQPPTNTTVFFHQNVTLHVAAIGPPTISYQWYQGNTALSDGANFSGTLSDTLTITDVFTNNGTTGTYHCDASNPYGTTHSSNAVVVVIGPPHVSIAYLRTLVDGNFLATNTTQRWQATGTVTTFTNLTTGDTSSYYLQDGTAGINIFVTHGSNWRPPQGVSVTFAGWLSSFNSTLELEADTNDLTTSFMINTNTDGSYITNALPAPVVIPFGITNDLAFCEKSLEGKTVMLTNVFFGTNAGTVISTAANTAVIVTNAAGETFTLLFSSQDLDTAGQTLPEFAYSVIGVFNQNLGNGITPRNQGYEVEVTRFVDIVTDAPPAVTISVTHTGNTTTLSWENVPWDNVNFSYASNYSYSVLGSASVEGPYTPVANYQAVMLGVGEVPANGSRALGFGTVGLNADQTRITVNMNFSGLSAPATAAHIHGPGGAGTNASVLFPFTGVPAATSGAIPEQSFSITPTQLGYLQNGYLYMNVHNSVYPGGEIRGQIVLVPAVGLTFANTSFTNTAPTTATYNDTGASGSQRFYKVTSP
jgi:hypothetical protein